MGATDFNTPPIKITLLAISAAVIFHGLTAWALTMVKTPVAIVPPLEVAPPIEIVMLPPIEIEKIDVKQIEDIKPEPVANIKTQPVAAAKPRTVRHPQASTKTSSSQKPATEQRAVKQKPDNTELSNQTNTRLPVNNDNAKEDLAEQKRILEEAQARIDRADAKAKQDEADAQAKQNRADVQSRQDKADAEAKQNKADAQAKQDKADAEVKAKKDREAAAANNDPVSFSSSEAKWASKPRFDYPDRVLKDISSNNSYTVVILFKVNKQGGITSVSLSSSSGNIFIDKDALNQSRRGSFKPFTKDGVPRIGEVKLPITYNK